jgi:hypothetical protein
MAGTMMKPPPTPMHPVMLAALACRWYSSGLRLADRIDALDQHQRADDAEHRDVGHGDEEIELAGASQEFDDFDAEHRADDAACQKDGAHLEVDILASPLGQRAGDRRGDDLSCFGADGDR